jgi:hypothetical protein
MSTPDSFAASLLGELRQRDPRAAALVRRSRGKASIIGIHDDGEFVPLLKLDAGSTSFNVMSLFVYHHGSWQPTLKRGIPADLADQLAGPLSYLWTIAVELADWE